MVEEGIALGEALAKYASKSKTFGHAVGAALRSGKKKGKGLWNRAGDVGEDVVKGFGGSRNAQQTGRRVGQGALALSGAVAGSKVLGAAGRFRDRHNFGGGGGNGVYVNQGY